MNPVRNKKVRIEGDRIYLDILKEQDATKEYCSWLNDQEVNRYLATKGATVPELKKYIKEKQLSPTCLFFGIFLRENKKHIGTVKLELIDFLNKKADIGIMIGDKNYWGKGIGTETLRILVNYAFQKLNLKEVSLGVISENKAAIGAYEKAGFKKVGVDEKPVRMGGRLFDNLRMSIKNNN